MNEVWYYDYYDLRKFKIGEIDTFIDIGSNDGSALMMMNVLHPRSRFIAIEPNKEKFNDIQEKILYRNKFNIDIFNIALGDGKLMYFQNRGYSGMHKFFEGEEQDWWSKDYEYSVESKTLSQIFNNYKININKSYIIKIDVDGGERFILKQEEESLDLFRESVQVSMEIHLGKGGSREKWNDFFEKIKDTHEIRIGSYIGEKGDLKRRFVYRSIDKFSEKRGWNAVEIINKDWIGQFPGREK